MRFPFISDPKLNVKSVTVTFTVVSFILSIVSICLSHAYQSCIPASIMSILLFSLCMLFYRLRKIDSFSVDLKSGKIEASDEEKKI